MTSSAIALVQSNAVQGAGVPSLSVPFPSNNTAGDLIIAFVRMSSATQTVAVTDSAGNIYNDAVSQVQNTDGHQVHIFYAVNIAGGANTVTAAFSASNNHPWLAIYEYSGLSTIGPLDQVAHAQGTGAAPATALTGTTRSANELVFAGAGFVNNFTGSASAGSGYTLQQQNTGISRAANETGLATSTASFAGTFTLDSATNWSAVLATFATTASAGSPTPTPSPAATPTATATASPGPSPTPTATPTPLGPTPTASPIPTPSASSSLSPTASPTQTAAATPTPSSNPIMLVQSNAIEGQNVKSLSAAFAANNTAGNLIIAFVRMSTTTQTVTVTDNAGNAYTDAVAQTQTTDGHQVHVFYARNVAGQANTVTAHFSGTNKRPWLAIYEYSGLNTISPLDRTAHAQGGSSSPGTGATSPTTNANELLFAGLGLVSNYSGTVTAGSGYVLQRQDTNLSRAANETLGVSSVGSYSANFSLSSSTYWSAVLATFTR